MDLYAYDAVDGPSEARLAKLCKKIGSTKTKDALIKGLKELASILEQAPQDVEVLGGTKDDVPRTLVALFQHTDKDVKLYLAVCVVHMLRIWAPSTPFEDEPNQLEVRCRPPCTLCALHAIAQSNMLSMRRRL